MTTANPLVAQRQDSTTWHTGLQIVDDASSVYDGVTSGNWIEAGLGAVATGMDALAVATNPIETLISYGLGWLIEHVQPLQDALNWVAGDPDQITAYAQTWKNISQAVGQASKDVTTAVNGQIAHWTGPAADAYRKHASGKIDALTAASTSAATIGTVVEMVGMVVGMVRWQVRTDVTEAIGEIIQDALEEVCTLGLATPVVIAQVVTLVSDWMANIAEWIAKLASTLDKLGPMMSKLEEVWNAIKELLADTKSVDAVDSAPHDPSVDPAGEPTTPSSAEPSTTPSSADPNTSTTPPNTSTTPSSADPNTSTTPGSTDPGTPTDPGTTTTPSGVDTGTPTDPGAPTNSTDPGTPGDSPSSTGSTDPSINDNNPDPSANSKPGDATPTTGDPIDVSTGVMLQTQTDVELPGTLPLLISRTYKSSYRIGRWFGPSWASTLDQRIEIEPDAVHFAAADGMLLKYPLPDVNAPVLPVEGAPWPLNRTPDGHYTIVNRQTGQTLYFRHTIAQRLPIIAIVDRNDQRIDIDYASDGTLIGLRHSGGYRVAVDTANGLVTALRLLDGGSGPGITLTRYRYDEHRHLTEVVNSSHLPMRFDYDAEGRMTRWEDRNGMWYRFHYDAEGRCVRGEGKGGYLNYTFDYDRTNRITRSTDSLGHTTTYQLNERLQVVAETDPLGNTTVSEWDAHHHLLSRTDPVGRTTRYSYDRAGNLTEVVRPDGSRATAEYNEFDRPVVVVEPDGSTWRYEYDQHGNVTVAADATAALTTYTYDDSGGLTAITDALGNTRRIVMNLVGLPVAVTDPSGATTHYARDVMGRVAVLTDPTGGVTRFRWSVEGRLLGRVLPDGSTEYWMYDGEGNLVRYVDANGQQTRVEIDGFDLPVAGVAADGTRLEYRYDSELRLVQVIDPQGLTWSYEYDATGNRTRETDFNGRVLSYAYNAAGELVGRVNGAGQTIHLTRDDLGNIVEARTQNSITRFAYDPGGRLTYAANSDATLRFERDPLGRVVAETCNDRTSTYEYDALGRRIHRRTPSGVDTFWRYDANGFPVELHTAGRTLRFSHDAIGRETRRDLGERVALCQTWDANHRLRSQALTVGFDPNQPAGARQARVVQRRSYSYRPDGCPTTIVDQLSGVQQFELDPVGRVLAVQRDGWTERYGYDPSGNITQAQWPAPAPDSALAAASGQREYAGTVIRRAGRVRYEHDPQGRVVLRQQAHLSAKPSNWRYTWDADDRLIGVVTPDRTVWRYRYDPLGRRTAKERLARDGMTVTERVDFTWDETVLAEQTHTGAAHRSHTITWDWDVDGVRPISQFERSRTADRPQEWFDERFYGIVTNLVGTPTELVDLDGTVTWRAEQTLWGAPYRVSGSSYTPLRFPGQYFDPETQLNYNVQRYYDPWVGRYGSNDRVGLAGGPNPQAYVLNPLLWIDPIGLTSYRGTLKAGDAGSFKDLTAKGAKGDNLTPHHMPQDALGFTPRNDGGCIALPQSEHELTRTYGWKGKITKVADAGLTFKQALDKDIADVRDIANNVHGDPTYYDKSINDLINYYKTNFPHLLP